MTFNALLTDQTKSCVVQMKITWLSPIFSTGGFVILTTNKKSRAFVVHLTTQTERNDAKKLLFMTQSGFNERKEFHT